jgi:Zn-dependent protease
MGGPLVTLIDALRDGNVAGMIASLISIVVILLIAFPLHELAHALAADYFGDRTPRYAGRITLNPFKHLSLLGSVLFLIFGFGWATTPINPMNFRGDYRTKHALVALAGPAMNIVIAVVFAVLYRVLSAGTAEGMAAAIFLQVCFYSVVTNVFLAFFNLIPIPPLDGGTVLTSFASDGLRAMIMQFGQYGFILLMALSYLGVLSLLVTRPAIEFSRLLLGN